MTPDGETYKDRPGDGPLGTAISNAVVQVTRQYTGRGPTQSKTYVNRDAVTVVLQDTLTTGEHNLVAAGESAHVSQTRKLLQRAMRDDLVMAVERLTKRNVVAFMSDSSIEPDFAIEAFVLESLPRE